MDLQSKRQEIEQLRARLERMEAEYAAAQASEPWQARSFYSAYYATTGFLLGSVGAVASLLANVVGAAAAGRNPLDLIRVYLTFPLGEQALRLSEGPAGQYAVSDGVILAAGCTLYLFTGMLLGVPFFVLYSRITFGMSVFGKAVAAIGLSLALWAVNFYGVLVWLQPALFGGDWITNPQVLPWWVAAGTHLVFGGTLALAAPLGRYQPYVAPRSPEDATPAAT